MVYLTDFWQDVKSQTNFTCPLVWEWRIWEVIHRMLKVKLTSWLLTSGELRSWQLWGRNKSHPITSQSLMHVHVTCQVMLKDHKEKMKSNEPGRQKPERKNSWRSAKHVMLHSDVFQVLNWLSSAVLGSQQGGGGTFISASPVPQRGVNALLLFSLLCNFRQVDTSWKDVAYTYQFQNRSSFHVLIFKIGLVFMC